MSRNVEKCIFRKYLPKRMWIFLRKKKRRLKYATLLTLSVLGNTEYGVNIEPNDLLQIPAESETKGVERDSETKGKKERVDGHRGGCFCNWVVFRQQREKSENTIKLYTKTARELVDIQGSLPPGSRMVHPHEQEIKRRGQENSVDQQGTVKQ